MNFSSPSKIEHVLFSSKSMGAEQDSLEQKLPASVVKALQLFMERSVGNKWAKVTETHLQAPAQQFDPDFIRKLIPKKGNLHQLPRHRSSKPGSKPPGSKPPKFATWVETARAFSDALRQVSKAPLSTLSSAAPSMPSTYSAHPRLHACSSRSCISSTPDMHEHASKRKNPHSITELLTWGSPFAKTKMPGYP